MRFVMQASVALSTAPKGFTASDLAGKVGGLSSANAFRYGPRQAAYDLKKLRGKQLIEKIGSSHRKRGPKPRNATALDAHYERLQTEMQGLFAQLGLAA